MKIRLEDKRKAIELRQLGYSYNEIVEKIPNLSKSTLSCWLRTIELTDAQKNRILQKIEEASISARIKGSWANKEKAIKRIECLQKEAESEYKELLKNPLFTSGLSLYWAEGSKKSKRFQFINSDPSMIKFMMGWLRNIFCIKDEEITIRLYLHRIYENEDCELFWEKITNIPKTKFLKTIYKPTVHNVKKNLEYKGCCRIEIKGSKLFWKICKWQEMLARNFT